MIVHIIQHEIVKREDASTSIYIYLWARRQAITPEFLIWVKVLLAVGERAR